jgi:hypothetical protein
MRKRRTRHAPLVQERFDVEEMDVEHTTAEEELSQTMELDENCALLQRGSADDDTVSPSDEVPALLSRWPPRGK